MVAPFFMRESENTSKLLAKMIELIASKSIKLLGSKSIERLASKFTKLIAG